MQDAPYLQLGKLRQGIVLATSAGGRLADDGVVAELGAAPLGDRIGAAAGG
jgi:hypothetical protein